MSSQNDKGKPLQLLDNRLRILCLHGHRQNGDVFKAKIGSFRKHLQKYVEFIFVSAPHLVQPPPTNDNQCDGPLTNDSNVNGSSERSWWFNSDDHTFKGTNKNGPAFGFDESIHLLEEAWQTLGPFHGILGFSQGACLVGLVSSLSSRGLTVIKPQFAVIAAGFRSGSLAHLNYYEDLISIPSLHIAGQGDNIIPHGMSISLSMCFEEPTLVTHAGGHYFAAAASQKQAYIDFFHKRLAEHLKKKELQKDNGASIIDPLDGIPSTSTVSAEISDDSD